ncbi:Zn(II)2Cys6 transcription factor [Aspergillus lucknowensis]|uniref:Zn(2)-C6 fungal-type domain-containing protein n=1 Tax=Aspergillus lucknowensis TaxID=176173 RepID=A0ABR4LNK4_9EURO
MPKVRTGCLTCKYANLTRRIKCDEAKPSCWNCSRTGRRCEGYATAETQAQAQRLPIRVYSLPFKVPGSQADRQLLHFYCVEAAGSLSSFSDPTLWTTLILQRSYHQPVIRHALVTLAGLYREYLQGGNRIPASASEVAVQRIARCHRQLRLYLRSPDASPETPLICSVLFYAFETLMGDPASAIQHLNNGLNLLKQSQASPRNSTDDILPHLTAIFSRLDVQASTFDDKRIPLLSLVTPDELAGSVHAVPDTTFTLAEGEAILTKLQNWMMHHIVAHIAHRHEPIGVFPAHLLEERLVLSTEYKRFLSTLDTLLPTLPRESIHRALLLRIQAQMHHAILLENIPFHTTSPLGDSFSCCTPTLKSNDGLRCALLDIQTFLSLDSDSPASQRQFTLCTQLVSVLYFLCIKAADHDTRETALALLQHSRMPAKDGIWETQKVVSILQALKDYNYACI